MKHTNFELRGLDGQRFACCSWLPQSPPRAVVQIAHGMGEHKDRYTGVAEALTTQGYAVYASDHRGHGGTIVDARPGAMGINGWRLTLADMNYLAEYSMRLHPGLPTVLLGHSMGAALSQQYLYLYGQYLSAAVLSGSPGFGNPLQMLALQFIARAEALRSGPDTQSALLQSLLFGQNNKEFEPAESSDVLTGFEWLSKDGLQVDAYLNDPQCGFVLSPASLAQFFAGMRHACEERNISAIKAHLPIYVFSGADDPVHNAERGLINLVETYRGAGLPVEYKLYPEGRHEMLNETNRVEVVAQLLDWLSATLFDVN